MSVPPLLRLLLSIIAVLLLWAGTRSRPAADARLAHEPSAEREHRGVARLHDRF